MDAYDSLNPYFRPDYTKKKSVLDGALEGGMEGAAAGGVLGPYGSLVTGLAGTALGAYGSYNQNNQAKTQYQAMVAAWEAEKARQAEQDQQAKTQQAFVNAMAGGNYAQGLKKDAGSQYGSYARAYGL